jgi:hypothetical protein
MSHAAPLIASFHSTFRSWGDISTVVPHMILDSWSTILFEKLTVAQMVKKFPAFYGTQRFITVFTKLPTFPIVSQIEPFNNIPPSL